MKKKDVPIIKQCIEEVLTGTEEKLLKFSLSKSGRSAYVLIGFSGLRYDVFRISNHKSYKQFFSHPTFSFHEERKEEFKEYLQKYLLRSNQVRFKYKDFFALKTIVISKKHNTAYFIDDVYLQFSNELTGLIFYQKSGYTKKKTHVNLVNSDMNQLFRKLYADGFINTVEQNDQAIQLYVTALGMAMLRLAEKDYLSDYLDDLSKVNWRNISLPARCYIPDVSE